MDKISGLPAFINALFDVNIGIVIFGPETASTCAAYKNNEISETQWTKLPKKTFTLGAGVG